MTSLLCIQVKQCVVLAGGTISVASQRHLIGIVMVINTDDVDERRERDSKHRSEGAGPKVVFQRRIELQP